MKKPDERRSERELDCFSSDY